MGNYTQENIVQLADSLENAKSIFDKIPLIEDPKILYEVKQGLAKIGSLGIYTTTDIIGDSGIIQKENQEDIDDALSFVADEMFASTSIAINSIPSMSAEDIQYQEEFNNQFLKKILQQLDPSEIEKIKNNIDVFINILRKSDK